MENYLSMNIEVENPQLYLGMKENLKSQPKNWRKSENHTR